MKLHFSKYQGTGNDFILVDDRDNKIQLTEVQVKLLCDRRFGIGADGLILLKSLKGFDFEMIYYNADGAPGSMCGNGGRCSTAFAKKLGTINAHAKFTAADGEHQSVITIESPCTVKLKMGDVPEIEIQNEFVFLNTGSPHYVKFVEDVAVVDVVAEGRAIRNSGRFKEKGTNVNFVQTSGGELLIRTYERGVEDETLSCGTGVTASALAAVVTGRIGSDKKITDSVTPGGRLKVYFEKNGNGFKDIWLEGGAEFVFSGDVEV